MALYRWKGSCSLLTTSPDGSSFCRWCLAAIEMTEAKRDQGRVEKLRDAAWDPALGPRAGQRPVRKNSVETILEFTYAPTSPFQFEQTP